MRSLITLLAFFCLLFSARGFAEQPRVEIATSLGVITVELDAESAPITVANFLQYVEDGFYDGTLFHRVIDGFMIQGGGFDSQFQRKDVRSPIQNEAANGLKNYRFTIAMARTNQAHSATSQFFINVADNDFLNHTAPSATGWGYAVFGKVEKGKAVVEKIAAVDSGAKGPFSRDAPVQDVVIKSIKKVHP